MFNLVYKIYNKLVLGKKRCRNCKGNIHADAIKEFEIVGGILTAHKVRVLVRCLACGKTQEVTLWIHKKEIQKNTLKYCVTFLYEN